MTERDIKYTSWVVSITSIIYGIAYTYNILAHHTQGVMDMGLYYYVYYVLFISLVVFGISKMIGILKRHKKIKRTSIVSLAFIWGFIWTSNIVETFFIGFDDKAITLFPLVAICLYLAFRGEYH